MESKMVLGWLFKRKREESIPIQEIPVDLEARLADASPSVSQRMRLADQYETFKYLGILDTYGVDWPLEKSARDTLQNFFDGNKRTLDGVDVKVAQKGEDYVVRISNHAEYDFRLLMHLGGTTKADDPFSAGGLGEGTKVLALSLLRDYGFSQVRFGSQNWELDFVLDTVPEGEYVEQRKGLFAGLNQIKESRKGNFIEFRTKNPEHAQAFVDAKKLFYSSDNPDFQNPSLDIPGVGGFKYLPRAEGSRDTPEGNFYYAGQRRHFEKEEWGTVEHVNLWTHIDDTLKKDRDRGIVTRREIDDQVIPRILDATSNDDLSRLVYEMNPIWSGTWTYEVGYKLLEGIAKRLADKGVKLQFDDKYLASTSFMSSMTMGNLKKQGYIICSGFLGDIGMKSAQDKFREMQQHYRVDTAFDEEERINILYEAIVPFQRDRKDVWVFDREHENSIIQGQYDEAFVWLSRDTLRKPFPDALATYLHEVDHKHGSDHSAEFSEALTVTLGVVMREIIQQPQLYQKLEQRWNQTLPQPPTETGMSPSQ
ncbi:TPA: hypothetical protein HA253_06285 [Candidatus Woesearchaeota archaeon]|nr:hypothetical protein [Candidatus Woesearchaeota archaeon]